MGQAGKLVWKDQQQKSLLSVRINISHAVHSLSLLTWFK
jgi:hypothetical protein